MSGTRYNTPGMTIARRRKLRDAWGEGQESKPVLCITGFAITEQAIMNIRNLPSVKGQLRFPTLSNCTESIHGGHVVQDTMVHKLISKGPYQTHARRIPRQARWPCRPILLKARPRSNKVASSLQPAAQDGLKLNPDSNDRRGLSYVCWQLELWQSHIVQSLVEAFVKERLCKPSGGTV